MFSMYIGERQLYYHILVDLTQFAQNDGVEPFFHAHIQLLMWMGCSTT